MIATDEHQGVTLFKPSFPQAYKLFLVGLTLKLLV
jgi:hypothetical protein